MNKFVGCKSSHNERSNMMKPIVCFPKFIYVIQKPASEKARMKFHFYSNRVILFVFGILVGLVIFVGFTELGLFSSSSKPRQAEEFRLGNNNNSRQSPNQTFHPQSSTIQTLTTPLAYLSSLSPIPPTTNSGSSTSKNILVTQQTQQELQTRPIWFPNFPIDPSLPVNFTSFMNNNSNNKGLSVSQVSVNPSLTRIQPTTPISLASNTGQGSVSSIKPKIPIAGNKTQAQLDDSFT